MSPSSIAAHTPTSAASWPIATWRNPGSSPARNRSSTFSSKRLMSSISRRKSRSRSSDTVRRFSTFATPFECTFCRVSLTGEWSAVQAGLPEGWGSARLELTVTTGDYDRAASLLGPAQPYLAASDTLHFGVARDGSGPGVEAVERLLARLESEGIDGTLGVLSTEAAPVRAPDEEETLA